MSLSSHHSGSVVDDRLMQDIRSKQPPSSRTQDFGSSVRPLQHQLSSHAADAPRDKYEVKVLFLQLVYERRIPRGPQVLLDGI